MKIFKLAMVVLMIAVLAVPVLAAPKKYKGKGLRSKNKISRSLRAKKSRRAKKHKRAAKKTKTVKMSKLQKRMAALDKRVRVFKKEPVYVDKNEFIRGSIYVDSKEKGLIVYLDNESMMTLPATFDNVKGGKHVIEGYKGADLVYRQYVSVKSSEPVMLHISGQSDIANEQPTVF